MGYLSLVDKIGGKTKFKARKKKNVYSTKRFSLENTG